MKRLYVMCVILTFACLVAYANDTNPANALSDTQLQKLQEKQAPMLQQVPVPMAGLDVGGDSIDVCTVIPGLPYQDNGNTCQYLDNYDEVCPYNNPGAPDVVYCYTPQVDTCVDISLCNSITNYDTKLYVYEGSTATLLACNDDACATDSFPAPYVSELVGLQLTANTTYYIVVDGYGPSDCGTYDLTVVGVPCPPPPPPPLPCPAKTIYGQSPHSPNDGWTAGVSDLRTGSGLGTLLRYDNFSGVNGPIMDLHWWGLSLAYPWAACDEDPMTFLIHFYQDAAGMPGTVVSTYTVTVNRMTTDSLYAGFPLYEWGTTLVPAVNLSNGWVSIQGTSVGTPVDCWFLWMSSAFGDGTSLLEDDTGLITTELFDLSLCLTGIEEEEWDLGDIDTCNYPTLVCNPSHDLSDIAWLGPLIDGESTPNQFDMDLFDDGVIYHNLPWMPCTIQMVDVIVTGGVNYMIFEQMGGHLYLNGWKDGNLDFDFADTLCLPTCFADEWIVQDAMVWPGLWTFQFMDPGVLNMGHYDGVFRWRLTSQPIGRQGFGLVDNTICPNMVYGTFAHDSVGEVEDYVIPYGQLPVELVSFDATAGDGRVLLNWSTASETDNDYFLLYRRVAGSTVFNTHAQIEGSGTSTTQRDYSYTDNACVNGITYEYRLADVDINGLETVHEMIVEATPFAGAEVPTEYALHQNWPNPFNATTMFRFDIREAGQVTLKIFDLMGREVATLVNEERAAGFHTISWDASELATGIYFYRLEVNGFTDVKKMLFLK